MELALVMTNHPDTLMWPVERDRYTPQDPLTSLLASNGYFVDERTDHSDGTVTARGHYPYGTWFEGNSEAVLHLLAQAGMHVSAEFVGSDDSGWAYLTRDGSLIEQGFNRYMDVEVRAYADAAQAAALLQDTLARNPTMGVDELRNAIRQLPTRAARDHLTRSN